VPHRAIFHAPDSFCHITVSQLHYRSVCLL
jgi:hypothetical protein